MISVQQPPAPVESTRASEIPAGHPFGDWGDEDFRRFEEYLAGGHETGPVCDRCGSASAELHDRLCPTCWLTDLERAAEAEQTIP